MSLQLVTKVPWKFAWLEARTGCWMVTGRSGSLHWWWPTAVTSVVVVVLADRYGGADAEL